MRDNYSVEINVTAAYKKYKNAHIAIREAMCMREMYPALPADIHKEDIFAGRLHESAVGFAETG